MSSGTTPHDDDQAFLAALGEVFKDRTPLLVHTTIAEGWFVLAALQLATRHPQVSAAQKHMMEEAGRQYQEVIVQAHPEIAELAERGWHMGFDVPKDG